MKVAEFDICVLQIRKKISAFFEIKPGIRVGNNPPPKTIGHNIRLKIGKESFLKSPLQNKNVAVKIFGNHRKDILFGSAQTLALFYVFYKIRLCGFFEKLWMVFFPIPVLFVGEIKQSDAAELAVYFLLVKTAEVDNMADCHGH